MPGGNSKNQRTKNQSRMMHPLYPLTFEPVLKRYLWGGRRLETVLNKRLGEGNDYAESWEIADHDHGQSVVANGPLAGTTLHELVVARGPELLGKHAPQPRFPLLFKFLDCQRDLSVQVHPNDAAAARLTPPDLGKTEAWVILDAQPGSRIYAGLKHGCDRAALEAAAGQGKTAECLHSFEARPGQCLFIPAGVVHALGAGLLGAEIQQASDTTFRLYDWGRVGPDGSPRQLHVNEALDAIDYSAGEVEPQQPEATERAGIECLVSCDKFVLERWKLNRAEEINLGGGFSIVSVLDGKLRIVPEESGHDITLIRGQTVLLPACLDGALLNPLESATVLVMYCP
jgi:mannose-6-phosphate isomerase